MIDRVVPYDECRDEMDMPGISQMVVYLIPTSVDSPKNVHHVIASKMPKHFVY